MTPLSFRSAVAVTKHDTDPQGLDNGCDAVIVGTAGDLNVVMYSGATVLITGCPAGLHELNVKRIKSTNTTAAGFTALWR